MNTDSGPQRTSSKHFRLLLQIVVWIFAALGFGYTAFTGYHYIRVPSVFSTPYAFLTLEIHRTGDERPLAIIYLDTSKPEEVRFEGPKLNYQQIGIAHFQSKVPFPGFLVSGNGRIVYGRSVIEIKESGDIFINGDWVNGHDFTVGKNGAHRDGRILIAR